MWFVILLRFLIPLIAIYFMVRFVFSLVGTKKNLGGEGHKKILENKESDPVIDICTVCGEIKGSFTDAEDSDLKQLCHGLHHSFLPL